MSIIRKWLKSAMPGFATTKFTPLHFPTSDLPIVHKSIILEEERLVDFQRGLFYPVQIGETIASRYQVAGKLGFGSTSTVWLARDMQSSLCALRHRHVHYRAREWEPSVSRTGAIWNVGVMIWTVFENSYLFVGQDPGLQCYSTRAHLAELIGSLGPPPLDLLQRGRRVDEFFDKDGQFIADVTVPQSSLEDRETSFEGKEEEDFLRMVRGMLQWRPEDRKVGGSLAE
ncbi:hypothetical protein CLAFUW4_12475 [Fulvia fulva]|uniref:non-specific serine/threonine protein kinase n=1 Tax=Passalora fulva TaxID=5499 RepID=A0A9Q8USP4_PASFU|nr:uncharacterized protein CLAFUR5_11502 [Fulvia fulva]KAK4617435.1 hypothetical protein CLAFUR4_12480 [Fulvia fulva]KAK4619112.1 hypothetical protein CLAFUR0_12491 [Fulvia fulva]UJO20980.1 hypothetical protein CLAFUR5_11502 [Fulvia fulva]WPV18426.1 hypothetical protein CLAFUW4_12475 [Fulvia fulva]WPV32983.1 hypothetical protein CLAFUW7_12482 [Fulvia fulva]